VVGPYDRRVRVRRGRLDQDHPRSTAFLDETGVISRDRFFGMDLLKSHAPARMLKGIRKARDALADPVERFGTPWTAYGKLAEQLIIGSLRSDELITVLGDDYSTPDRVLFEEDLERNVNRRLERLSVVSAGRLDSRSSDGIQAADLFTGATAFEFLAEAGLASPETPRGELAAYVRRKLGAESCLTCWRNHRHSVAIYQHRSRRQVRVDSLLDFSAYAGTLD
jgi:hypothetical protein